MTETAAQRWAGAALATVVLGCFHAELPGQRSSSARAGDSV